jgi:GAF domain-containing protein
MVHGQAIGFVQFERQDPALNWTDEEITLLKTLTGQVALTLENSRLLEEAQLKAEQERLVGEITTRIRASNDRDQILQTALDELRLAFPSDQIKVRFRPNDANELLSSVET